MFIDSTFVYLCAVCLSVQGCSFGYFVGGWGKPPVDELGRPLYGDVFGMDSQAPGGAKEEEVDQVVWGELESEEEDESEEEEVLDAVEALSCVILDSVCVFLCHLVYVARSQKERRQKRLLKISKPG